MKLFKSCLIVLSAVMILSVCYSQSYGATINIKSPKSGDIWKQGQTHTIVWDTNIPLPPGGDKVNIILRKNGKYFKGISGNFAHIFSTGKFPWTIPSTIPDGIYTIRLYTPKQASTGETALFTIEDPLAMFEVTNPKAGDSWYKGEKYPIKWKISGIPSSTTVNIDLYQGTKQVKQIAPSVQGNLGSFDWTVPNILEGKYFIILTLKDKLRTLSANSGNFTIKEKTLVGKVIAVANLEDISKHNTCEEYEKTAIAQNKENEANKCGYKGGMWSSTPRYHYDWCKKDNNSGMPAYEGNKARKELLDECLSEYDVKALFRKVHVFDDCDEDSAGDWEFRFAVFTSLDRKTSIYKDLDWDSDVNTGSYVLPNKVIQISKVRGNDKVSVTIFVEESDFIGGDSPGYTGRRLTSSEWKTISPRTLLLKSDKITPGCGNVSPYEAYVDISSKLTHKGESKVKFKFPSQRRAPAWK